MSHCEYMRIVQLWILVSKHAVCFLSSRAIDFRFKRSRVSSTGSASLRIFGKLPNPRWAFIIANIYPRRRRSTAAPICISTECTFLVFTDRRVCRQSIWHVEDTAWQPCCKKYRDWATDGHSRELRSLLSDQITHWPDLSVFISARYCATNR